MKKLFPLTLAAACLLAATSNTVQAQGGGGTGHDYECQVPEWDHYVDCVMNQIMGSPWPYNCGGWKITGGTPSVFTEEYVASCNVLLPLITPPESESYCSGDLTDEQEVLDYWSCVREEIDEGLVCTMYTRWSEQTICALCGRKEVPSSP